MSNKLILRVNDKLVPEFLIQFNPSENSVTTHIVSTWTEIKPNPDEKLIILIPAHLVFSSQINIPSKNDEIIRQSIPYAIEEQLATDIEYNHYAYKKGLNQELLIAVIAVKLLQSLVEKISQQQLICEEIYSEIDTCPRQLGTMTICAQAEYLLIRDDAHGTSISPDLLDTYLSLCQNKPQVLFTQIESATQKHENRVIKTLDLNLLQAQTICTGAGVNLLQGIYAVKQANKNTFNPKKKMAVLASVLLLTWLFVNIFQIWELNQNINSIKKTQTNLLREILPNASQTELKDPFAAMLSRLKLTEQTQSKANNQGFIQALIFVGQTLQQIPAIEIMSLRHRNAKLEVKLQAADVGSLNQFQQNLEKLAYSMRVKTGTRDSNKDGYSAIITLEQL